MNRTALFFLLTIAAAGCTQSNSKVVTLEYPPVTDCYAYTENQDTISLMLTRRGMKVDGNLEYRLYEKDRNTGTISGNYGSTMTLTYTFQSEGVTSKRTVVLKKQPNGYLITNEGNLHLKRVECADNAAAVPSR